MATIPKIYKSTDPNAPVIGSTSGGPNNIVGILKACLVDGYNLAASDESLKRPGAGWAMPFSDANGEKAVFRNNAVTGSGGCLTVEDATKNTAKVIGSEGCTALDAPVAVFGERYIDYSRYDTDATAMDWLLIADDRFFYFFLFKVASPFYYYAGCFICFGDPEWFGQGDTGIVLSCYGVPYKGKVANGDKVSVLAVAADRKLAKLTSCFVSANIAATIRPDTFCVVGFAGHSIKASASSYATPVLASRDTDAPLLIDYPVITDGQMGTYRGQLPGFCIPSQELTGDLMSLVSVAGKDFIRSGVPIRNAQNVYYPTIRVDQWRGDASN